VAEARGRFGNPEEGERPPLEAATEQLQLICDCGQYCIFVVDNCVVPRCILKSPNPVYSHAINVTIILYCWSKLGTSSRSQNSFGYVRRKRILIDGLAKFSWKHKFFQ
jgi:hypothetical protein